MDSVEAFLKSVISGDPSVVGAISEWDGEMAFEGGLLVFSLEGLRTFVVPQMSARAFQSELYSGSLNQNLNLVGYKVDVFKSTGKVATNWYVLKPLS